MLDHEDLKWIATTSTELNSMLEQISRYSDLARQHKGEYNYIELLGERVEMASRSAQALFDRVTSSILDGSAKRPGGKQSTVVPFSILPTPRTSPQKREELAANPASTIIEAPIAPPPDIRVLNPEGELELILIIEDEVEVGELAAAMLTDVGYRVIHVKDGFEALRIYQHMGKKIGLVILDFFLPVMDGDAVFDELLALNPNVSVVLSSGFAEQSKLGTMLAQGLRGFIPKPYSRVKLLEQVRSILDAPREKLA